MADFRDYWDATKSAIADRSLKSFAETLRYSDYVYPDADDIRKMNLERAISDEDIWESRKKWEAQQLTRDPGAVEFNPHDGKMRPMREPTLTDRVLDAVHDYMPARAQKWIEDRAFTKELVYDLREQARASEAREQRASSLQSSWDSLPEAEKADIDRRLDAYVASAEGQNAAATLSALKQPDLPEIREDRFSEITRKYGEAIRSGETEFQPTITKPTDLESYRQEQIFRSKPTPEEQRAAESWRRDGGESYMAELANRSQTNVDYRQLEMWATKQEQNQAAWAVAAPVVHGRQQEGQAQTMVLKP